jgi:hypothetical protein
MPTIRDRVQDQPHLTPPWSAFRERTGVAVDTRIPVVMVPAGGLDRGLLQPDGVPPGRNDDAASRGIRPRRSARNRCATRSPSGRGRDATTRGQSGRGGKGLPLLSHASRVPPFGAAPLAGVSCGSGIPGTEASWCLERSGHALAGRDGERRAGRIGGPGIGTPGRCAAVQDSTNERAIPHSGRRIGTDRHDSSGGSMRGRAHAIRLGHAAGPGAGSRTAGGRDAASRTRSTIAGRTAPVPTPVAGQRTADVSKGPQSIRLPPVGGNDETAARAGAPGLGSHPRWAGSEPPGSATRAARAPRAPSSYPGTDRFSCHPDVKSATGAPAPPAAPGQAAGGAADSPPPLLRTVAGGEISCAIRVQVPGGCRRGTCCRAGGRLRRGGAA